MVNGVISGAEIEHGEAIWKTFTRDMTNIGVNDVIEIWLHCTGGWTAGLRNMRILFDEYYIWNDT